MPAVAPVMRTVLWGKGILLDVDDDVHRGEVEMDLLWYLQ